VASGQDDQSDVGSVGIYPGDPVKQVNTGGVIISVSGDPVWGIVVGILPYWDGTRMVPGNKLPNQTTWGTVEERRSQILVVPATAGVWEIDCDDTAAGYDTKAEYEAFVGENVTHVLPDGSVTGVAPSDSADPYIDISTHATTNTLTWRIEGVSPTAENQDFATTYVKMLVRPNLSQEAGESASGNAVAGV
jgi:hypothetical protein